MKTLTVSLLLGCSMTLADTNHAQEENAIANKQETENFTEYEEIHTKWERLAPTIYAELAQLKDRQSANYLAPLKVEGELRYDEYDTFVSLYMYQNESLFPKASTAMRHFRNRLSLTEKGRMLARLSDKESELRQALRRGDKNEALRLNEQLIQDYEALNEREKKEDGLPSFPTSQYEHAQARRLILLSEQGKVSAEEARVLSMVNNPYMEGEIGQLKYVRMPSVDSPVFACHIGKQLRASMSLAEVYELLRRELGKGATPYIFAIKLAGKCVSDDDVNELRKYVQASRTKDGDYQDTEAAYLLAEYLWKQNTRPVNLASDYETWKEGFMIMMQLSRQNADNASMFLLTDVPRSLLRKLASDSDMPQHEELEVTHA